MVSSELEVSQSFQHMEAEVFRLRSGDDGYQYEDLIDPATHIRLLKLSPMESNYAPISGELIPVALTDLPKYIALSYVWGPETPQVPICLNEEPFIVHQNLYAFLWHYIRSGRMDMLWVDAVCIDQQNKVEKNSQVGKMGNIFRSADAVVIWLGTPEQSISDALNFHPSRIEHGGSVDAIRNRYSYLFANQGARYLEAMKQLWGNPYFFRLWIVQEFMLARKLYVQYGMTWFDWDDFCAWMQPDTVWNAVQPDDFDSMRTDTPDLYLDPHIRELIARRRDRDSEATVGGITLFDMVAAHRTRLCKDPRDRVYGILALVTAHHIMPDYQINTTDLFFQLMGNPEHVIVGCCVCCCRWEPLLDALELDLRSLSSEFQGKPPMLGPRLADLPYKSSMIPLYAESYPHFKPYWSRSVPDEDTHLTWTVRTFSYVHVPSKWTGERVFYTVGPTPLHGSSVLYFFHGINNLAFVKYASPIRNGEPFRLMLVPLVIRAQVEHEEPDRTDPTPGPQSLEACAPRSFRDWTFQPLVESVRRSGIFDIAELDMVGESEPCSRASSSKQYTLQVNRSTFVKLLEISVYLRQSSETLNDCYPRPVHCISDELGLRY